MKIPKPSFLACVVGIWVALTGMAQSQGVQQIKTSYKHYSIFSYQDQDILCEPYVVKKNDWLYKILRQKGEISEHNFPFFISIFKQINPHIHNIDTITTGTRILIPLKITDKHDYIVGRDGSVTIPVLPMRNAPSKQTPATAASDQLQRLQDYANAINGKLIHQGKLYFPGRNGRKEVQLDLSSTPVIETQEPEKTVLIVSHHSLRNPLQNEAACQTILSYWKHVKIQPIETILHSPDQLKPGPSSPEYYLSREQIFQILTQTGYDYIPEETIRFHVNRIPVSVRLGRVKIPNRPDLLLNFGTVYGQGIDAIQQLKFKIVSFSSKQDRQKQIQHLLSALGYHVWHNPSFTYQGIVETLTGVYGEQSSNRLFISSSPVAPIIRSFLETRQIQYVFLQP